MNKHNPFQTHNNSSFILRPITRKIKHPSFQRKVIVSIIFIVSLSLLLFNDPLSSSQIKDLNDFFDSRLLEHEKQPSIPSTVQLCQYFLNHDFRQEGGEEEEQQQAMELDIEESYATCTSPSPYDDAIPNMIHSSILVQNLHHLGYTNLQYQHRCQRFGSNTVQMNLPPQIQLDAMNDNVSLHLFEEYTSLRNSCQQCVMTYNKAMEEGLDTYQRSCSWIFQGDDDNGEFVRNYMIQTMVDNIRMAASSSSQQSGDEITHHPSITSDISSISRSLLSNQNSDAPDHDGEEVTVLYLNPSSMDGNVYGTSKYLIASLIQRSVTNVHLVPSYNCLHHTKNVCMSYAEHMFYYFQQLVPRARTVIDSNMGNNNSQEALELSIKATTFICSSVSTTSSTDSENSGKVDPCLILSLARRHHNKVLQSTNILLNASSNIPHIVPSLTQHITFHSQSMSAIMNNVAQEDLDSASKQFLNMSPGFNKEKELCPLIRGRLGTWKKQNDMSASKYQYITPVDHIFGFADSRFIPSSDEMYRSPTTYHWEENVSSWSCHLHLLHRGRFCDMASKLSISRVFFVGDFVGMNQAYSFWKLLGHEDSPKKISEREPNWERYVECPQNPVKIQFVRNDMMIENDKPVDLIEKVSNCGYLYCYNWSREYMSYYQDHDVTQKTLMIASFGPHYYSEESFTSGMSGFLQDIETKIPQRLHDDFIFYRTITPGHDGCNKKISNKPFQSFEDYRPTITSKYSWDLHDGFNDIANRMIREFNYHHQRDDIPPYSARNHVINILDVYPMTVLRRDGHVGGRDCRDCSVANDCFYYSLPGPSDWWNHLLFSNIADLYRVYE